MSLADTRLDLAVRVAARALQASPGTDAGDRLAVFRGAYDSLARLDAGDPDWTAQTMQAAWALIEAGYPRGGPPGAILADLVAAHAAVVAVAERPPPERPARPRRDA